MAKKCISVLVIACIGTAVLFSLFFNGITPPTETIYIGVPIFGFLGALAYWKV